MFLRVIIGPMFSGKTTHLIGHYQRLIASKIKPSEILVINHTFDTRYSSNYLATHNEVTDIMCEMMSTLMPITINSIKNNNLKAILINEGQFFNDITQWIRFIFKNNIDIEIIVSGLDADFKQEPFGDFLNIIPYCRDLEKLTSICTRCSVKKAELTIRTLESQQQVIVGNHNIYQPVCSDCYC